MKKEKEKRKHKQTYNHQTYVKIVITLHTYILKHDFHYLISHDPRHASQEHKQSQLSYINSQPVTFLIFVHHFLSIVPMAT